MKEGKEMKEHQGDDERHDEIEKEPWAKRCESVLQNRY
jgi:hypothetical protein